MGDKAFHPSTPGVGEAASLQQACHFDHASLYLATCLLSGFGLDPLWVTGHPTFPAALTDLDSQPESLWSHCEEVGVVAAIREVAPAVCKVWQVGSIAGEVHTGHPASSSFPG